MFFKFSWRFTDGWNMGSGGSPSNPKIIYRTIIVILQISIIDLHGWTGRENHLSDYHIQGIVTGVRLWHMYCPFCSGLVLGPFFSLHNLMFWKKISYLKRKMISKKRKMFSPEKIARYYQARGGLSMFCFPSHITTIS